VTLLHNPL